MQLGKESIYSINKKNYRTLENLRNFFKDELTAISDANSVPLLLIDDEADNASVDTSRIGEESSRINGLIKELLDLFPRNAYLAYTATPFANILINPEEAEDLFPNNFIMTLGRPDNYIGPKEVFGTIYDEGNDEDFEVTERDTDYNWFRNLDAEPFYSDWEEFIPNSNKEDSLDCMDELPSSLQEAIYSFIISVAVHAI